MTSVCHKDEGASDCIDTIPDTGEPGATYESASDETVVTGFRGYRFERVNAEQDYWWAEIRSYPDSTIFQTRAWVDFVSSTQQAEPILVAVKMATEPSDTSSV